MTFIDGAKITKRHNGAGWCAIPFQTDKSSVAVWTCSVRDCRCAEQTADYSTLCDHGIWSFAGRLTSALWAVVYSWAISEKSWGFQWLFDLCEGSGIEVSRLIYVTASCLARCRATFWSWLRLCQRPLTTTCCLKFSSPQMYLIDILRSGLMCR